MRSAIITAVLALAYGIVGATAAAAPGTNSGSDECLTFGWQCSVDGSIPTGECCEGLYCWSGQGLPAGVSSCVCDASL